MSRPELVQEIDGLIEKNSGYRMYSELHAIGATIDTEVSKIPPLMVDKSILIATIYTANGVPHYPTKGGLLTIKRHTISRVELHLSTFDGHSYFAFWDNGTYRGWKQMAITSKVDNLSLVNGWENYSGWDSAKAVRNGSTVHLSGLIRLGNKLVGTTITTLPPEYRPLSGTQLLFCDTDSGQGRLDIMPNGQLIIQGTPLPSNVYVSLNGVSWNVV